MTYEELISNAEFFYDEAERTFGQGGNSVGRYLTASILFSFMAAESFINDMMADFVALPTDMFTVHERGFLSEHAVRFCSAGQNAGKFEITNNVDYKRLEDKIMFLIAKFGSNTVDKGSTLWQKFEESKDIRDQLTHPRRDKIADVSLDDARKVIGVSKELIQLVAKNVWNKNVQF